jgi:hypothetical protein
MGHLGAVIVHIYCHCSPSSTSTHHLRVRDSIALGYLVPTFGSHRILSSKMTSIMPPRRVSQSLHPDESLPQDSTINPPLHQPSTQIHPTITEGLESPNFGDIPEVQLHQPANMSTTTEGSSHNGGGASSTQTSGCVLHQSPPRTPSPIQVIHGNTELDQIQVQDCDEEAYEVEIAEEEEELISVQ